MARIIGRQEFLEIDKPVLYCKYSFHEGFGELCIKRQTTSSGSDWYFQTLVSVESDSSEQLFDLTEDIQAGARNQLPLDFDSSERDGCFDDNQKFAVFSSDEVKKLAELIRSVEN